MLCNQFDLCLRPMPHCSRITHKTLIDNGRMQAWSQDWQGGRFGDPETNRKVEAAAVSFITQWYKSRGWEVESVEAKKCGYDLLCVKGSSEEHVEVKGTQGDSLAFIIT